MSPASPSPLRAVCVFTGSSPGARPEYAALATRLAAALVRRGVDLVYGGARVGLMGRVADAVLAGGGRVIGVIPASMVEREVAHDGLTELVVVDSMHERKAGMAHRADGFVALPGGIGTLEELFEVYTWAQLGLHRKPCGLLDVAGYYDGLVRFLDHAVEERFLKASHRRLLVVERDPDVLLDRFAASGPPGETKWIDP